MKKDDKLIDRSIKTYEDFLLLNDDNRHSFEPTRHRQTDRQLASQSSPSVNKPILLKLGDKVTIMDDIGTAMMVP